MKKRNLFLIPCALFMLAGCGEKPNPSSGDTKTDRPDPPIIPIEGGDDDPVAATPKEKFVRAKTKTYENSIYEYTYSIEAKIKFAGAVNYSPVKFTGTVQYDASSPTTQYLHKREATGLLVFDYTTYTYNSGTDLITVNADENKKFSIVDNVTIPNNYDFDTNCVGVVLKTLAENDNLSVTKNGDKYDLALKTSFKTPFLSLLNYLDSQKILDALSDLTEEKWGVGFTCECYAKLNTNETTVSDFHLGANVNVKDTVEISLAFDQHFQKIGGGVSIQLPTFENTFISASDIESKYGTIKTALNNSKNSYYEYSLKTAVDHGVSKANPLGLAVNSHPRGYAEREIIGDKVYFHNGLEMDSDYKNKDQYPDKIEDYKYTRAKVKDGSDSVYDVIDGTLKNTFIERPNYNNDAIDDYYMLFNESMLDTSDVKLVRQSTKDTNTIYELGLSTSAIQNLLTKYNKYIRLDADEEFWLDVYDIGGDFKAKKAKVEFELTSENKINTINMEFKGFYIDKKTSNQVKFDFDLDIEFDYKHKAYTAPNNYKDIELPNFSVLF